LALGERLHGTGPTGGDGGDGSRGSRGSAAADESGAWFGGGAAGLGASVRASFEAGAARTAARTAETAEATAEARAGRRLGGHRALEEPSGGFKTNWGRMLQAGAHWHDAPPTTAANPGIADAAEGTAAPYSDSVPGVGF
jgi:hypothetical protein